MSKIKFSLVLSLQAEQDLADILRYTMDRWGEKQQEKYQESLDRAIRSIEKSPDIGRYKSLYAMYFLNVERHVIAYKVIEKEIFIVRVLHQRMDAKRHLI